MPADCWAEAEWFSPGMESPGTHSHGQQRAELGQATLEPKT